MRTQVIRIHVDAPAKPAAGAACNGCGLCCLASPCPVGILVSLRLAGACKALRWRANERRYRCAMADNPAEVMGRLPHWLAAPMRRLAHRWIAAGIGCDCTLEPEPPASQ